MGYTITFTYLYALTPEMRQEITSKGHLIKDDKIISYVIANNIKMAIVKAIEHIEDLGVEIKSLVAETTCTYTLTCLKS